jgi:uncharacterized protein (DUF488 family)
LNRGYEFQVCKGEIMEAKCNPGAVWTIGHSNHKAQVFQALLKDQSIEMLIDVRSKPVSRFNPQFNRTALVRSLQAVGVEYRHLPELGGLHASAGEGEEYEGGLEDLIAISKTSRTAIMCSEADPASCHREYLIGAALRHRGMSNVNYFCRLTSIKIAGYSSAFSSSSCRFAAASRAR